MSKSKAQNKFKIQSPKIIKNTQVLTGYYRMQVHAPWIARSAQPGQFVQVKVCDGLEPLLRRPLGVHRVMGSDIELLYEVVGKGTQILSSRKKGEHLDIIGPLGNGFVLPAPGSQLSAILVAGGMGVAPLVFLAEKLNKVKGQRSKVKGIVLIGASTRQEILCEKEFRDLGFDVKITTDDGSRGFKGKVTDLLKNILLATRYSLLATIYACGPHPMLSEVARLSQRYNIPAQVSLEEHMACGFGACLGCVVKTKQGYQRVCKEGPVFSADEIIWEK